jgi:hypothetical protein
MRIILTTLLALCTTLPLKAQTWVAGQQLTITPRNLSLPYEGSTTVQAYARTSTGRPVNKPGITWTSRNPNIVFVQSKTNDVADVVGRSEGHTWIIAAWKTRSGTFMDSILVSVNPKELGSLPWMSGQQLLLLPKVNEQTVILKERDSVFLQALARTSQGIPVDNPLVEFSVNTDIASVRRITNATGMLVLKPTVPRGVLTVVARWNTRSGVFVDSTRFFVEPTPEPTPVTPPSIETCPNQPTSGFTTVLNRGGSSLNEGGNTAYYGVVLQQDPTAPLSSNVISFRFAAGTKDGGGGILEGPYFAAGTRKLYVCIVWKQSENFVQHFITTKFIYPYRSTANYEAADHGFQFQPNGDPTNGSFRYVLMTQSSAAAAYSDNVSPIVLRTGTWYRTEYLAEMNTPGVSDGRARWWTSTWNGSGWSSSALNANHSNVRFSNATDPGTWTLWRMTGYMGGQGGTAIPADQYITINRKLVMGAP